MKLILYIKRNANKISFGFVIAILLILSSATIIEKIKGTAFAQTYIYNSWAFILMWFVVGLSVFFCILQKKIRKQPVIFLIHLAIIIILFGGFLTRTTSVQGKLHLRTGQSTNTFIDKKNNTEYILPFDITLSDFKIIYYQGTQAPSDYVSTLKINYDNQEITGQVSINKIFSQKGYRFYQSGYDKDEKGSFLLVKSDRYGLAVTYFGYFLLLLAMAAKLLKRKKLFFFFLAILLLSTISATAENKNTIPANIAKKMGELQIMYHDRVCPLETFAKDFTLKLHGKSTYKSLSCEEVLCGYLFYFEDWKNEPLIKIKAKQVQQLLGKNDKYVSFSDFFVEDKYYKLSKSLTRIHFGENIKSSKEIIAADEKIQLIFMLRAGALLKMFPIKDNQNLIWYSPADELPDNISENERLLIQGYFELLTEYAIEKNWQAMETTLEKLRLFQKKSAGNLLASEKKLKAEHLYNKINNTKPVAFGGLVVGLFVLIWGKRGKQGKWVLFAIGLFLLLIISLRGYISGRIPLGNGFETTQFLALCIIIFAFLFRKKSVFVIVFGFIFSSLVLLVSSMGASNPQITQLQPVLLSPLLSVHVSLIMMAYTLFGFITFNSIVYLCKRGKQGKSVFPAYPIYPVLLPAVFLLTAGIIAGAIWAEISWGNYWSWDPKETWALITLIIYALPLHSKSLSWVEKPILFNIYMIFAFLSVLMTCFGVNYLLGGLHSYA